MATSIIAGLGGKDNIVEVDNCATRLRITVKDSTVTNDRAIKAAGGIAVVKMRCFSFF